MKEIEDRIRDRVERWCDMAPLADAGSEAWATWKRRVVSGVADIVAEEIERANAVPDCPNGCGPMTGANPEFATPACAACGEGAES